jgi:iron complex outermembrane receptor protein
MPALKRIVPLALLAALPAAAVAQEILDPVVVTATRAEEPSLRIPASVDRIYADEIEFARPQVNLSETLNRVPGVVASNRQNYAQDLQISIRGFGARSTFGVRGIRLLADGIPATMPDGQGQTSTFDLNSAERIEVLRGPFATLYGANTGGVINVITQSGPAQPTLWGDFFVGSYDTWGAALKFGGQSGGLNGLGAVSRFMTDGYRDHSNAQRNQLNAKVSYGFSDATSLTMVVNSLDQPNTLDPLGLTAAQVRQNPRQAGTGALQFNTRKTVRQSQGGLALNHRLVAGDEVQATAYYGNRAVNQYLAFAGAAPPPTAAGGVVDLDRDYGGGALRWSRPFALSTGPFRLSAGAEYEAMSETRRGYVNNNGIAGALRRNEDDTVWSLNFYLQGEWTLGERWIALLGVRTTRTDYQAKDFFITPGNPDDSGSRDYSSTSPAAGLLYRISPSVSVYANYGRGFETPTFAELAYRPDGSPGLNFSLDAATSNQYEAGVKAIIAGRARVNAAVFRIDTQNEIVVATSQGGRTTFQNAGDTKRTGFELAAGARLPAGFDAYVAYTWLNAIYADSFPTVGQPAVPVVVPSGNRLPGVPRENFYGELRWSYAPAGFTAALEVLSKGKVAVNDQNSQFAAGWTIANLALVFTQQWQRLRLSEFVRVDNVFDKQYVGSVIVNEANGRYYEPSPTRNWLVGIQASVTF